MTKPWSEVRRQEPPDSPVREQAERAGNLSGCSAGGDHVPDSNEFGDAWCSKCGERLLLPGFAGGPPDNDEGRRLRTRSPTTKGWGNA